MDSYFAFLQDNENNFILDEKESKHIEKVMRYRLNDQVMIVYKDQKYLTQIIALKPLVKCQIISMQNNDVELNCKTTLIIGLLKNRKEDEVIKRCVELGVFRIVLWDMDNSVSTVDNAKNASNKISRWQAIAQAAAQQSKRNFIPEIGPIIINKNEVLKYASDLNLLAFEQSDSMNLKQLITPLPQSITIVIGPEGGISSNELSFLVKNSYHSISLGKRILRADTAPYWILSVIGYEQEIVQGEKHE